MASSSFSGQVPFRACLFPIMHLACIWGQANQWGAASWKVCPQPLVPLLIITLSVHINRGFLLQQLFAVQAFSRSSFLLQLA